MKPAKILIYIAMFLAIWGCKKKSTPTPDPPVIGPTITVSFKDTTIVYGDALSFSWTALNATSCQIQGKSALTAGSMQMNMLLRDTTLTIIATGIGGSITKTVSIKVIMMPKKLGD